MRKILLSILCIVIGVASSYGQCPASASFTGDTTGTGGITATGAYDDMAPVTTASGGNVVKGYYGLNWYPTPDSVQTAPPQSAYPIAGTIYSQWFSYEIYQLNRVQVNGDWKMKVTATNADSNFSTFGIGFPTNAPRNPQDVNNPLYGIDLSGNGSMSIDVDNSANVMKDKNGNTVLDGNGNPVYTPLFFTANLTDIYGTHVEYMADTTSLYNYFFPYYNNWYKAKFQDTISASSTTVNTSLTKNSNAGAIVWPGGGGGRSPYSTSDAKTTVNFDFTGGWNVWIGRNVPGYVPNVTTPTKNDSFPCSNAIGANVPDGHSFAWYCPSVSQGGPNDFDFTQVISIAFYFNGGGVLSKNAARPLPNPDPTYVGTTGISYPVFTGTVYLDNFKIGTANSPAATGAGCWNYQGCENCPGNGPTGTTNAVTLVPKAALVPNPASAGQAVINDPSGASSYNITVTNTVGAVILTTTGTSFNVPAMPGMYFVTYSNGQAAPTTLPLVVK